ncbi:MAG: SMC-Scp complex subunit ScpB [Bacillota bacterium]|nr:SMC-Scp complex subunit ScpB [Bacillota bacterium]
MKKIDINQLEMEEASTRNAYFSAIESLLFASGEPMKLKHIAAIINCHADFTKELIDELAASYAKEERGIKLISINDQYQLVTKSENSHYVQRLLKTNTRQALSQAALETLSIIAYKQPITRIDIDEIRGVKSDRAILTLHQRNLIKECGRLEVPGRPILYSTTDEFLKYFDLRNLESLPSMDQLTKLLSDVENNSDENSIDKSENDLQVEKDVKKD